MNERRLSLLKGILSINSTNGNEEEVANYIANELKTAEIDFTKVPYAEGRASLVAQMGEGAGTLAFSGHMDVVSAGEPTDWETPPFVPSERGGRLYARGATDMKSGLAAMVMAMIELKEAGVNLKGKLRLLATVGEEIGYLGSRQLTDEGYAEGVDALVIGEPSGRRIGYAHKGIVSYTIKSTGKSAHSSTPELGYNAIDNLIVFYNKMMEAFQFFIAENAVLGKFVYCNSIINGGQQINSVPDTAVFQANLRTIPEVNNETVISTLERIVADLNGSIEGMHLELQINQSSLSVQSDIHSKLVKIVKAEAEALFGESVPLLGGSGGTDAAEFVRANSNMQVVIFGPGNETMHKPNEYVDIAEYLEMVELYKKIAVRYFEEDEQ